MNAKILSVFLVVVCVAQVLAGHGKGGKGKGCGFLMIEECKEYFEAMGKEMKDDKYKEDKKKCQELDGPEKHSCFFDISIASAQAIEQVAGEACQEKIKAVMKM